MTGRGGAEERVLRIVSLLFGVAAIVFGLLDLRAIENQLTAAPLWWTAGSLVAILGAAAVLGATAAFAPVRLLRALAAAVAVGYLVTSVSMPFVYSPSATSGEAPWPLALTAVGTTAAALVLPAAAAWSTAVVLGVLIAVDRIATAGGGLVAIAVQDAAYGTFFAAVFVGLTLGARTAARRIDLAAAVAGEIAAAAAADRVRLDERGRVDALVHDRVLATLLLAGRDLVRSEAEVRRQAGGALDALTALADGQQEAGELSIDDLADRLRNQATLQAPWAQLHLAVPARQPPVLVRVAEALLGATGEALRNAVRYAGSAASIALRLEAENGRVVVTVLDDGEGFDPRSVPQGRMGVSASIVGRLRAVGGEGVVRSRRGRGTSVQLIWRRP